MKKIAATVAIAISAVSANAATFSVVETRITTINVEGTTNFNPGFGPTEGVNVLSPSVLGLPDGTFLGTPEFTLTLNFAELFIDYRFERDVNVAGNLAPNVRVTPAVLDIGPVSDRPVAEVDGRFVRGVTPTTAEGSACAGSFTFCYAIGTNDLSAADFSGFVDILFTEYGTTRSAPGAGTVQDFSGLAGSGLTFGALGYDGVFSNNDPVAGALLFDPRFRFDYDLTYTQPYLLLQEEPNVIPLPATLPLLAGGILMLGLGRRWRIGRAQLTIAHRDSRLELQQTP